MVICSSFLPYHLPCSLFFSFNGEVNKRDAVGGVLCVPSIFRLSSSMTCSVCICAKLILKHNGFSKANLSVVTALTSPAVT